MWFISLHWLVEVSTFLPHLKHLPCQFLWPFWGPSRATSVMWCEARLWLHPLHKPGKAVPISILTLPCGKSMNWSMCRDSPMANRPSTGVMVSTEIQCFPLFLVFSSNEKREVLLCWHFNFLSFSFCTFHGSKLNFRLAVGICLGMQKGGDQYKYLVIVWGLSSEAIYRIFNFPWVVFLFFFVCILQTRIITVNCVSLLNDTFYFSFAACVALYWSISKGSGWIKSLISQLRKVAVDCSAGDTSWPPWDGVKI